MLIPGAGTAKNILKDNLFLICLNKNSSIISLKGTSPYHVPSCSTQFCSKSDVTEEHADSCICRSDSLANTHNLRVSK